MRFVTVLVGVVSVVGLATGCPAERKEAIDQVGGAPKAQIDQAKERIGKAEDKIQKNADAAAAVPQN